MNVDSLKYKIQQVAGNWSRNWPEKWNGVKSDCWIEEGRQRDHGTRSFKWFGAEMHLLQMVYRIGPPGLLTKLVKMPVRRRSGTHHSQTGHRPATNCCLGQCWTLFSPYNTKCSKIIPYSTQKTQSGPLLRVAHYLTRYSRQIFKQIIFEKIRPHLATTRWPARYVLAI